MKTSAPTMALIVVAVAPMIEPMRAMQDPVMKNLSGKKARDVSNSISHSHSAIEGGFIHHRLPKISDKRPTRRKKTDSSNR